MMKQIGFTRLDIKNQTFSRGGSLILIISLYFFLGCTQTTSSDFSLYFKADSAKVPEGANFFVKILHANNNSELFVASVAEDSLFDIFRLDPKESTFELVVL